MPTQPIIITVLPNGYVEMDITGGVILAEITGSIAYAQAHGYEVRITNGEVAAA